jgi:transposase
VRAFEEKGLSYAEIADLSDVGEATVSRILRLHRETGGVDPLPRGGGNFSPIQGEVAEELRHLVITQPDATSQELTDSLINRTGVKTSSSGIKRALHRMGFTRKKSPSLLRNGTSRSSNGAADYSRRL